MPKPVDHYLGIEIGGTKLQLGLGPGDGTLRSLVRKPVEVAAGPEGIRRQILGAVPELLAQFGLEGCQLKGVGIGFGGPVDDATHTIIKSHQIKGWDNFPLAAWITNLLGWPAVLGNDSDVAGLAEALFGAGKGLSPIYYLNVGSGIGGGLIINGRIYRGSGRGAAETGHLRMPLETASGMKWVPLEDIASGWAIARRAREVIFPTVSPGHESRETITVAQLGEAALGGDRVAAALLNQTWEYLAEAICHVIALLCPRRIVVGGGVSLMGQRLFFDPLCRMVAERVFRPFASSYEIVPASLGEEVVVQGAVVLAQQRLGGRP